MARRNGRNGPRDAVELRLSVPSQRTPGHSGKRKDWPMDAMVPLLHAQLLRWNLEHTSLAALGIAFFFLFFFFQLIFTVHSTKLNLPL